MGKKGERGKRTGRLLILSQESRPVGRDGGGTWDLGAKSGIDPAHGPTTHPPSVFTGRPGNGGGRGQRPRERKNFPFGRSDRLKATSWLQVRGPNN